MVNNMHADTELGNNSTDIPETRSMAQYLKVIARVFAVCASIFVILARDGIGPRYFDPVGKAIFWIGIVFVPLLGLNQDVLRLASAKLLTLVLWSLQFFLVFYFFRRLQDLNFITLALLCFAQFVIFALPFMLIRKRSSGIWY